MWEVALIVGAFLLYKAYKLRLKHSERLRQLEAENQRLREEIKVLRQRYGEIGSRLSETQEEDSPAGYLARVAARMEKSL